MNIHFIKMSAQTYGDIKQLSITELIFLILIPVIWSYFFKAYDII